MNLTKRETGRPTADDLSQDGGVHGLSYREDVKILSRISVMQRSSTCGVVDLFEMLRRNHRFKIGEPRCRLRDPIKIQARLTGSSDAKDNDGQHYRGTEINQSR
jgi:hypothetical protein